MKRKLHIDFAFILKRLNTVFKRMFWLFLDMKRLSIYTIVALGTFFIGIAVVAILAIRYSPFLGKTEGATHTENQTLAETINAGPTEESPEVKAIRIAEEFISQNGYTDLPADKGKMSYETVEFEDDLDQLLESRANTLERKAFGLLYTGSGTKMGEKGWTVVFRSKNISDDYYKSVSRQTGKKITKENHPIGRAVTMDSNFQELLVEHKDFPLQNVDKKL